MWRPPTAFKGYDEDGEALGQRIRNWNLELEVGVLKWESSSGSPQVGVLKSGFLKTVSNLVFFNSETSTNFHPKFTFISVIIALRYICI